MRKALKTLRVMTWAGVVACVIIGCGSPAAEETSDVKKPDLSIAVQVPPAQKEPVEAGVRQLSEVVADHILPLTTGPWPDCINVTDRKIIFKNTGKEISYDNVAYCRAEGEGLAYRFEYDVPVCLPSGKGLALFEAAYGYECWGASVKFYNPDGRLLSTLKKVGRWLRFAPDGERFIHYVMGDDDYDDWDGVELRRIDGKIHIGVQVEQALAFIKERTGYVFTQGGFYLGPRYDLWVTWDERWDYFAFAFEGWNRLSETHGIYLFIYSAEGELVQLRPMEEEDIKEIDSVIRQAIDDEFVRLGTKRGGSN